MKALLWFTFYFLSFLGILVGVYFSKDKILQSTAKVPVLNYTQYHKDAFVEDSSYTEKIDSLAVVVEGMLNEMTEYVSQIQDRDTKLARQKFEIDKLTREKEELTKIVAKNEERAKNLNKAADEKKLTELAKMLGTMKPDVLRPILDNLPDRLVQIFYDKAKTKDRKKIFQALPPERAGKILNEMAGE